jgi:hypothetical protein
MFEQSLYRLSIQKNDTYTIMGKPSVEYHFTLGLDDVIWRSGVASSPEALGRAIGDAVRDHWSERSSARSRLHR